MKTVTRTGKDIICGDYILVDANTTITNVALKVIAIDDGNRVRRFWGKDDMWVIEVGDNEEVVVADLSGFVVKQGEKP